MSSFYAIDFKDRKLGVLDKFDKVVEYYTLDQIKSFIKDGIIINGVTLDEKTNPIYTLNGLKVNLAYRKHKKFGKWIVAVLKSGDKYGSTLSSCVKEDTVMFYDSSVSWSKQEYPFGQFISSYYLQTLLEHTGGLSLDASIPSWCVDAKTFKEIREWLENTKG